MLSLRRGIGDIIKEDEETTKIAKIFSQLVLNNKVIFLSFESST
jgi:hypothetical protein